MANEISYEVLKVEGRMLLVKYSLGEHSITVSFVPEGDVMEAIKQIAPKRQLLAMRNPAPVENLVGQKGTLDLENSPESTPA